MNGLTSRISGKLINVVIDLCVILGNIVLAILIFFFRNIPRWIYAFVILFQNIGDAVLNIVEGLLMVFFINPIEGISGISQSVFKGIGTILGVRPSLSFDSRFTYLILGFCVALIIISVLSIKQFVKDLPNPRLIGNINFPVSTKIVDRHGELLYEVYRDINRTPISLSKVPEAVIQATLATEDRDFFSHNGVSPVGGIARAIKDSFITGKLHGGSTITQQLIKTSLLSPERTISRKIREIILAVWAEKIYSKDEILEMYLNQVSYGGSAYGIEEASKTYYHIGVEQLSVSQIAFLVGLPKAPTYYSPYTNPHRAKMRRDEVLKSMLEVGYLSDTAYDQAITEPLDVKYPTHRIKAPHFVFYTIAHLEQLYGIRRVEEGGLYVVTTLDLSIQEEVEQILREEIDRVRELNVSNGAVLVTHPSTGDVLAMVGSYDYYSPNYGAYNVTLAKRQPGSSIKPLLYSLALEEGEYTAQSIVSDSPVTYNAGSARPYRPVNYDRIFHGDVTIRTALANSYNVPAVKVLDSIGLSNFISHARKMGITTWEEPDRYGLSLALGGAEVRLIDMAEAYGVFANRGVRITLSPLLSVEDYRGVIYDIPVNKQERVISEGVSFILSDILSDDDARLPAFGHNSLLAIDGYNVAVKTGTTDSKRDNVTIGYTPDLVVVVWVGNNDNSPMDPILTSGITGASPIWNRTFTYLLSSDVVRKIGIHTFSSFVLPENVVSQSCVSGVVEYFIKGTEKNSQCILPVQKDKDYDER